jgi:hypothetical protein
MNIDEQWPGDSSGLGKSILKELCHSQMVVDERCIYWFQFCGTETCLNPTSQALASLKNC